MTLAKKITRDAFLYLEAKGNPKNFAQCRSCALFSASKICGVMSRVVSPDGSCGLYVQGDKTSKVLATYSPKEVGYVKEEVRCENCRWGGKECGLYKKLNTSQPATFDLDTKIKPYGCCTLSSPSDWLSPVYAFLLPITFWTGIAGAATSPRWALVAFSLYWISRVSPLAILACVAFIAFCFWTIDFDQACHWAFVCGAMCWGARTRSLEPVVKGFALGVGVSGIIAIGQLYGFSPVPQVAIPGGLFLNKNVMGEAACLAFLAVCQFSRIQWAIIPLVPVILSASRAAWLACLIGLMVLLPLRLRLALLAAALLAGCLLLYFGVDVSAQSLIQRVSLWNGALHNLHWLGSGSYDYSTVQHREPYLHNDWLQFIYELGVIGVIPIAVVLVAAVNGGSAFILGLLVLASFGFPLHMPATAWFIAFIVGHLVWRGNDESRAAVRGGLEIARHLRPA